MTDEVMFYESLSRLVTTAHVPCPDCGADTFGPYYEAKTHDYFDGHYCQDCGITWHWRKSDEPDRNGFVAY